MRRLEGKVEVLEEVGGEGGGVGGGREKTGGGTEEA